jgi:hypothetical protein
MIQQDCDEIAWTGSIRSMAGVSKVLVCSYEGAEMAEGDSCTNSLDWGQGVEAKHGVIGTSWKDDVVRERTPGGGRSGREKQAVRRRGVICR